MRLSKGNYFTDTDGNQVLDLNCVQPLGYNHDAMINARDSDIYDRFLQGGVSVSSCPPSDWADILSADVMPVAPNGLNQVQLANGTGTGANEAAIQAAMTQYGLKHGKSTANLCVMGFGMGAHGSSIATLSCSDEGANARNVPTFDWPVAPAPKNRLPFAQNEQANLAEEERCL